MRSLHSVALLGFCVLFLLSCGGSSVDSWEPSGAVQMYELRIVDSITVFDVPGDNEFLSVADIGRAGVGEILILDDLADCIHVFSSTGGYMSRLGRSGTGRARLSSPSHFEVLGNGDICVVDGDRWKRYYPDGEYNQSVELTNVMPMRMAALGEFELVGILKTFSRQDGQLYVTKSISRWSEWAPDEETVCFLESGYPLGVNYNKRDILRIDLFPMVFAVGDNYVYIAPNPQIEPRVQIYNPSGQLITWIDLPYERVLRPKEELLVEKLYVEQYFYESSRGSVELKWRPSPYRPMIRSLGVDSFNNLWVQRGTELTPTFDVYDHSQNLIYTIGLPDREDAVHWRFDISDFGIIATPPRSDNDPVVYILERDV
jgi:hypothetical protein